MRSLLIIMLAFFVFSINGAEKKDVKLFILSGQSNAAGAGNGDLLPDKYKLKNNEILLFQGNKWHKMAPYKRTAEKFNIDSIAFGAELSFAYELKDRYPNHIIAISKVAIRGGTSIVAWDKDNERDDWIEDLKEVGNENKAKFKLYDQLISDTKKSIELLREREDVDEINLSGMLWLQTERDGHKLATIRKYEPRLIDFIYNIRTDLDVPELPFFVMDAHIVRRPYLEQQQAMLRRVSDKINNVHIIKCEDLPTHEGVHFNTKGQIELGKLFAHSYIMNYD